MKTTAIEVGGSGTCQVDVGQGVKAQPKEVHKVAPRTVRPNEGLQMGEGPMSTATIRNAVGQFSSDERAQCLELAARGLATITQSITAFHTTRHLQPYTGESFPIGERPQMLPKVIADVKQALPVLRQAAALLRSGQVDVASVSNLAQGSHFLGDGTTDGDWKKSFEKLPAQERADFLELSLAFLAGTPREDALWTAHDVFRRLKGRALEVAKEAIAAARELSPEGPGSPP